MTGDVLARRFRAVLHHDTFELFVAPAIADLQCGPSPAAYAAVWTSFAGAVIEDLIVDGQHVFDDLALMVGLIAMQVCYYGGMLLLLVAHVRADQVIERLANGAVMPVLLTVSGVVMASTIPTLLCFWPPRRTLT